MIAGSNPSSAPTCQIVAQSATLDIKDSISVDRQGSVTQEGMLQSILTQTDIVNYNLDISCFSGGKAEGFVYYIPIPKTTSVVDGFLIEGDRKESFDLEVNGPITLTGSDVFNFGYTFETGLTYEQAKVFETWYTKEEIENDSNLKWKDVTMIRISLKGDSLENGSSSRITVQMKYGGTSYETEAGFKNIWHSGGVYNHINSDRETAGNYSTTGAIVDLKHTLELDEITLTAAKDMTPLFEGNVNTKTIEETVFPQFKKVHTFSITSVDTYNVILQTKEYIETNIDMPGIDANRTFGISVSMDGQTEKDVLSDAQINPVQIGKTTGNDEPQFTFKIYNADALSDNSQTRYIIVTLTSDNGITIKQRININREIAVATDAESAIVAGKRYLMFEDITSQVTISQDSAFTSQFIVSYIPDVYKNQIITFSDKLPIGTNIVMANLTNIQNPSYWYYKLSVSESTFNLKDFIAMGKIEEKYTVPTGIDLLEEKILLIVDFSQCNEEYMAEGTYTVKIIFEGNNEGVEVTSEELEFVVKQKRTFLLENDSNIIAGNDFNVSYSMKETEGAESKYEGRKLSLVMIAPTNIPSDARIKVNDMTYYLNLNKQFIIPLGDIEKQKDDLKLNMNSNMFPDDGAEYIFDIELWVSATANAEAPMLGEKVGTSKITVTVEEEVKPSLKVTNMDKRIIHRNELNNILNVNYKYMTATNCKVTVELQQKIGTAYQKITDKLNQVNNNTNHNVGVFEIISTDGTNQATLKLSSATPIATYRFLFKVKDEQGIEILQIPYNFMVIEDK